MKKLRIWESAALISLCITLLTALWAQGQQAAISGKLIRLHVVAVNNEPAEQGLKLRVRDSVLAYISPKLEGAESPQEAESIVCRELKGIASAAAAAAEGRKVTVSLAEESYPTKSYRGFSLPAGRYRSLKIVLGEGRGENWWCVVFPPVCLCASQAEELLAVLGEDGKALVCDSENHEFRFKILELWGEFTEKFTK